MQCCRPVSSALKQSISACGQCRLHVALALLPQSCLVLSQLGVSVQWTSMLPGVSANRASAAVGDPEG